MKHLFTLLLLISSLATQAQRERYADSLLLDAQYDKVIQWSDEQERTSSGYSTRRVLVMTRKAEALVRLGKYDDAEQLLQSLARRSNATAQAAIDIAYGSL